MKQIFSSSNLFLKLLALDLITKVLAYLINPQNMIFKLVYNQNMVFGIEMNNFVKFGVPFFGLLWFSLFLYFIETKEQKLTYIQILGAGFVGNYICRFFDSGVIDFIVFGNYIINVADILTYVSLFYVFKVTAVPRIMNQIQKLSKVK